MTLRDGLWARAILSAWTFAVIASMICLGPQDARAAAAPFPGPACATPQTATVNAGGSVTFDVSDCDGTSNVGVTSGNAPSHGSLYFTGQLDTVGTERITYTNNGDGATSDSFYIEDEYGQHIVFNITINPARTASISVSPTGANEDSGTALVYTVTLSPTNSAPTTVNLTRSGTATSGTDYTGAVSGVVVPANTASVSFSITPVADTTVEGDESVIFNVASGTGYSRATRPAQPPRSSTTIFPRPPLRSRRRAFWRTAPPISFILSRSVSLRSRPFLSASAWAAQRRRAPTMRRSTHRSYSRPGRPVRRSPSIRRPTQRSNRMRR